MDKKSKELLSTFLNEVLEDCRLFGAEHECYCYHSRETNKFIDYSLDQEKEMYIDEVTTKTTLFDLFCLFIAIDLSNNNVFTPTGAITVACRNISDLTQVEFAKKLGITVQVLRSWEQGSRNASLNNMIALCKAVNVDYNTFFKTYENLLNFK